MSHNSVPFDLLLPNSVSESQFINEIPVIKMEENKPNKTYTMDEALSTIGSGPFQWKILMITGLFWSTLAMMIMVLTFIMPVLTDEWNLSSGMDGIIGTIYFIGMFFGSIFWSTFSDRFGRKLAIILSSLIQIVFGLSCAFAPNIYVMMPLMCVTGFSIGGTTVAYTLYAEFAPKEGRGKYLVFQQSFWAIGALLNTCVAWFAFTFLDWRWYIILTISPLIFVLIGIFFIPESVRWLFTMNRYSEAVEILENIAKINKSRMPDGILQQMPSNVNEKKANFFDVFHDKYFHISVLLLITMSMCAFGYFGISFLSERIFDQISTGDKYWEMIITVFSELPGIFIAMITVDRYGRRLTMIVYFAVFGVCMLLLVDDNVRNNAFASTVLVFCGRMCISMAYIIIIIYFSEYFPTRVRNTSLGMAHGVSSISTIAATYLSQSDNIGYASYLYGISGLVASVCCFALFHDTQDTDMSEVIDDRDAKEDCKSKTIDGGFLF